MIATKRLIGVIGWGAAALLAVVFIARLNLVAQEPSNQDEADTIRALQEERRDILAKRVKMTEDLVKAGRASADKLIVAKQEVLEAELEMAVMKDQRIKILRELLENAKWFEGMQEGLHKIGETESFELLDAKADRLKIEIRLHQELRDR